MSLKNKGILFVVPSWSLGGTEIVNVTVANKLSEEYNVLLYTLSSPQNEQLASKVDVYGGSNRKFTLFTGLSGLLGMLHLKKINCFLMAGKALEITRFCEEKVIDTIVVSSGSIYLIPFLKKQNPEKKVIAWCHFSADTYLGGYLRYTTNFWVKGLAAADNVVCLTNEDKVKFSKINGKTVVINNPLTIENKQMSSLDNKIISWTGRISNPQKGIDYLAEIAANIPEGWKISVAGDGDIDFLKECLLKNGAEDKVILRGSLSGEKLKQHYLNSSIYLMTSRFEGFGLVLVEAMSFGLPIVAFEQSGSKYVLESGKFGILTKNGDIESIVEELTELTTNPVKREMYQKKSLKRLEDFNIDKVSEAWKSIIF